MEDLSSAFERKLFLSIKLPLGFLYKVYVKHKWVLCIDLGPTTKITPYVYADFPTSEIQSTLGPKYFK